MLIGVCAEFLTTMHIAENTIFGSNTGIPWLLQHNDTALFQNVNQFSVCTYAYRIFNEAQTLSLWVGSEHETTLSDNQLRQRLIECGMYVAYILNLNGKIQIWPQDILFVEIITHLFQTCTTSHSNKSQMPQMKVRESVGEFITLTTGSNNAYIFEHCSQISTYCRLCWQSYLLKMEF